jgi:CubicO group peptidase (beta-lactamase class C family)
VPYLNFTSGWSNFSNVACRSDGTVAECMNGARNEAEAAAGAFHYQGGHMQQLGVVLGLGPMRNAELGAEVRRVLGPDVPLAYASPQPPGGLRMTPRAYANFLRRLLVDSRNPLRLGAALGTHAVCTSPSMPGCNASSGDDTFLPEPFHYSLGHWVEDNPASTPASNFAYSSAGAFGFYPWVDTERRLYGMVARENTDLSVRQGYASLQCGRLIRLAWKTAVAQTGTTP